MPERAAQQHLFLSYADTEDPGTAAGTVTAPSMPEATRTTAANLTERAGFLRQSVGVISTNVRDAHHQSYEIEWEVLTQQRGTESPVSLLEHLGDLGFAWRDIARLLGVSVPAVKKWRAGVRLSGTNRRKLAGLVAACDFLADHYCIEDIASWFEMPIHGDAPITPVDLWAAGETRLFFDYGASHTSAAETLSAFDPEWRERYRTDIDTFRDADGNLGLRMRER